jgi:predicted lipoprotein
MKQKYQIVKDPENDTVTIREYAELDKDILSPLCEEVYSSQDFVSAIAAGKEQLFDTIRTKNMYPPGAYVEKIAIALIEMFTSKADQNNVELFFDDIEMLNKDREKEQVDADLDSEADIDELLADDYAGGYEDKESLQNLKVADDEYGDVDEES